MALCHLASPFAQPPPLSSGPGSGHSRATILEGSDVTPEGSPAWVIWKLGHEVAGSGTSRGVYGLGGTAQQVDGAVLPRGQASWRGVQHGVSDSWGNGLFPKSETVSREPRRRIPGWDQNRFAYPAGGRFRLDSVLVTGGWDFGGSPSLLSRRVRNW